MYSEAICLFYPLEVLDFSISSGYIDSMFGFSKKKPTNRAGEVSLISALYPDPEHSEYSYLEYLFLDLKDSPIDRWDERYGVDPRKYIKHKYRKCWYKYTRGGMDFYKFHPWLSVNDGLKIANELIDCIRNHSELYSPHGPEVYIEPIAKLRDKCLKYLNKKTNNNKGGYMYFIYVKEAKTGRHHYIRRDSVTFVEKISSDCVKIGFSCGTSVTTNETLKSVKERLHIKAKPSDVTDYNKPDDDCDC